MALYTGDTDNDGMQALAACVLGLYDARGHCIIATLMDGMEADKSASPG